MVNKCSVSGCKSNYDSTAKVYVPTFRFPKQEPFRTLWINAVSKSNWQPTKNTTICKLHFSEWCFSINSKRLRLLPNAVPSHFPNQPESFVKIEITDENVKSITPDEDYDRLIEITDENFKSIVPNKHCNKLIEITDENESIISNDNYDILMEITDENVEFITPNEHYDKLILNFQNLILKIKTKIVLNGWNLYKGKNSIVLFVVSDNDNFGCVFKLRICINSDLFVTCFRGVKEEPAKTFKNILSANSKLVFWSQIRQIITFYNRAELNSDE